MRRFLAITLVLIVASWLEAELYAQDGVTFTATELLGRPTDNLVAVNVLADEGLGTYFEYGTKWGVHSGQTDATEFPVREPTEAGQAFAEEPLYDECTAGVADGDVTVDGRPLLWKLRNETEITNDVRYFASGVEYYSGLGPATYSYLGMGPADDYPGGPVRHGLNSQGLAIGWNALGYDGWKELHHQALGHYGAISQVRTYVNGMTDLSTFNYFIDSGGEATLWENQTGIDQHWEYNTRATARDSQWIDVDNADTDDDPWTGGDVTFLGWVVRTNFGHFNADGTDDLLSGGGRYVVGRDVIAALIYNNGIGTALSAKSIAKNFFRHDELTLDTSVSNMIVHGVRPTEDPRLSTMWTLLGHSETGIFVPVWIHGVESGGLNEVPGYLDSDDDGLCVYTPARGMYNAGFNGADVQARTLPFEAHLFDVVNDKLLPEWRERDWTDPTSVAVIGTEMKRVQEKMDADAYSHLQYLYDNGATSNYAPTISIDSAPPNGLEVTFSVTANDADAWTGQGSILIDFSVSSGTVTNPETSPVDGRYWNSIADPNAGSVTNALWSDGTSAAVDVVITDAFAGDTASGSGSVLYPGEAQQDGFFVGVGSGYDDAAAQLEIRDLDPNKTYDFTFFGSRNSSEFDRRGDYTIGGETVTLDAYNNTDQTVSILDVSPNANGTVVIDIQKHAEGDGFAYLNVLEINEHGGGGDSNLTYLFNYGDGQTGSSATHAYVQFGRYLVSCTVTDENGVSQTDWLFVTVSEPTCDDGLRNQGEDLIDCGGPCPACACLVDDACGDGVFCNGAEMCNAYGECQAGSDPCPGQFCDEDNDVCFECNNDSDCDDGLFCNGVESCDGGTCQAGSDPCPGLSCDEVNDECVAGPAVQYAWNMDSDPGWSTGGLWAWGQPTGSGGQYGGPDPTSGYTGSNVYGYNLSGDYENDLSETHLTSTAIDCTGLSGVTLKFQRWLNVEHPAYDHAYIRVSNDGTNWTTIWENTAEVTDSSWTPQEFDISSVANGEATVYVRWTMGTTDSSWQYSGWNIDDVEIWATVSGEPTCNDGVQNQGEDLIDCGGPCPACACLVDDACGDGVFCNGAEMCNAYGECQAGSDPCPGQFCDEDNDVCFECNNDSDCDDGLFCNGVESCDGGTCQAGSDPCPGLSCDEVNDECVAGPAVQYAWNMDSDPGWSTGGLWAWGQPTGSGGQYGGPDPTSGYTGSNVYGYNLSGDYENDLSETHLTSTAIDCTGLSGVTLKFQRWLNVEHPAYDHAYIRVSNDGTNWTTIWENTAEVTDSSWTPQEFDISSVANGEATVYVRWTMGTTDSSWQYSGWNIDDVEIWAVVGNAPVADDQAVSTDEDTPVAITLTASDVDGDNLSYTIVNSSEFGTLSGTAPDVTYTPDPDYNGSDSFTFKANDGQADSNIATVSVIVNSVNDPPVADDQAVSTDEDTLVAITLTASDVDGDSLTYSVMSDPSHGTLSGTAPDVTYTPDPDYTGPDSFTFQANDGQADSNIATVSITVTPVNNAPVADDQAVSTDEDTPVAITLTASDVDGDLLTYSVVSDPSHGTLSGTAPDVTYTPDPGYNGSDSFTFKANDGQADSNTATVSITVTALGPTAQLESGSVTVGGDHGTVNLDNAYVNPVVVCSVQYNNNTAPVVARVSNVTSTSFNVWLQNPSGGAVVAENVSYLVVEQGTWTIDGVKVEAQTYLSTVTDENNSWVGEAQGYGQSYTKPVVLGQVMSENDPDWSVFWCQGSSRTAPPSATALKTGKTVGEDTDTTRADETIGFIVFEAGHGTIGGVEFEALVGADTVRGVTESPPYVYSFDTAFSSAPQVAITTLAGMDGGNGGWAQTHGSTLATTTSMYLSIDEDQVTDDERNHTNEQVSYVVFEAAVVYR